MQAKRAASELKAANEVIARQRKRLQEAGAAHAAGALEPYHEEEGTRTRQDRHAQQLQAKVEQLMGLYEKEHAHVLALGNQLSAAHREVAKQNQLLQTAQNQLNVYFGNPDARGKVRANLAKDAPAADEHEAHGLRMKALATLGSLGLEGTAKWFEAKPHEKHEKHVDVTHAHAHARARMGARTHAHTGRQAGLAGGAPQGAATGARAAREHGGGRVRTEEAVRAAARRDLQGCMPVTMRR
jgi:hypothetical protein